MAAWKLGAHALLAVLLPLTSLVATAQESKGKPPSLIREGCRFPDYPQAAVPKHATSETPWPEGTTTLELTIDAKGKPEQVAIKGISGDDEAHHALDRAAAIAFMRCMFSPALDEAGAPVEGKTTVEYAWHISGQ